jgi:hypothetical protein
MKPKWVRRGAQLVASIAGLAALTLAAPSQAAPFHGSRGTFADEGFRTVWTRTDAENVRGGRSWYWGPSPWFDYAEFYRQGENGLRTVQYFDKARMEINNPDDRNFQNGVTNGLLVVELVSGHLKKGNDPYDYNYGQPADVPVAGDPKAQNANAPTYASFTAIATFDNNGYKDPNRLGQRVSATIDKSGNVSTRDDLATDATQIVQYNTVTGHNIPRVFWNFMNLRGSVVEGGAVRSGAVVDWTFAMGLPITDPYWTKARVGGQEKDVLVQLFERRALTYVADNPAGFQVEMGNVGQHYFQWRYAHLGQPWAAGEPDEPLLYASDVFSPGHWEVLMRQSNGGILQLTNNKAESVAFSYRRSYEPNQTRVLIDSRRGNGEHRQLYELDVPPIYGDFNRSVVTRRLTFTDGSPIPVDTQWQGDLPNGTANEYNASVSPDGTKVVFVSDRMGVPQLFIMTERGSTPQRINFDGCLTQVPVWSPDGRSLYWERQCEGGKYTIMKGDLKYNEDNEYGVYATLENFKELTDQSADNRFPRVSPDGSKVVFTSYRDGNAEIYVMNADGSKQTRLTNDAGEDEAASWNAAGTQLAFAGNRDGDYEIYVMNADGSNVTRLTDNAAQDRWVMWAR